MHSWVAVAAVVIAILVSSVASTGAPCSATLEIAAGVGTHQYYNPSIWSGVGGSPHVVPRSSDIIMFSDVSILNGTRVVAINGGVADPITSVPTTTVAGIRGIRGIVRVEAGQSLVLQSTVPLSACRILSPPVVVSADMLVRSVRISFVLPDAPVSGSVFLLFRLAPNSPVSDPISVRQFGLGEAYEIANATLTILFDSFGNDLPQRFGSTNISSVAPNATAAENLLVSGAAYNIEIRYRDFIQNPIQNATFSSPVIWNGTYSCPAVCRTLSSASQCIDQFESYKCVCASGYSGVNCEIDIDECASNPCRNGGTCTDGANQFTCACAAGFSGSACQTDINECGSNPCTNGGTCADGVNSFACTCASGFSGLRCETNIDECASLPCQHGGTCHDANGIFTCACVSGYSGAVCETDVNECGSSPCAHGGTCADAINGFTCTCVNGYSGAICQTDINECNSLPCANGGTCIDQPNGYTCRCAGGFSGVTCTTDITECASNPCVNGATCYDAPNSYSCGCTSGYSGRHCQTDINECASLPCFTGACTDLINGFNCTCPPTHTGTTCVVDVNECATNNGGCGDPARSNCSNIYGDWRCTPFIPDAAAIVLSDITSELIHFDVSTYHANATAANLLVTIGSSENPKKYNCTNLQTIGSVNITSAISGEIQSFTCLMQAGSGRGYNLHLFLFGVHVSASTFSVSYAAPTLVVGSLRDGRPNYPPAEVTQLSVDVATSVSIRFRGANFVPSLTTVRYGPNYECTVDVGSSSANAIYCETAQFSAGSELVFTVTVDGQSVSSAGAFGISFPTVPLVVAAAGCVNSGNQTAQCPTDGGTRITISGQNFVQTGISVSIGSRECLSPSVDPLSGAQIVECTLPASTGGSAIIIVTSLGSTGRSKETLLSYAPPQIERVVGCTAVVNSTTVIRECPRAGNASITLFGKNFGLFGARVSVGSVSALCTDLRHDPISPHTQVTCTLPSGTGEQEVSIQQSGGEVAGGVTVERVACQAGTFVSGLACEECGFGEYTEIESAQSCRPCAAGKYTGVQSGGSNCFACPSGRISAEGKSACANCTSGYFSPAESQPACIACVPGRFAASNGTVTCTDCAAGKYQSESGASHCVACELGKATNAGSQVACVPCAAGSIAADFGTKVCTECEIGTHQPSSGSSQCLACPNGQSAVIAGRPACTPCAAGSYRTNTSGIECVSCDAGTAQPGSGQAACAVCDRGTFSAAGAAQCTACPSGKFTPEPQSTACVACPEFSTSKDGGVVCECAAGYYATDSTVTMKCIACPEGALCQVPGLSGDSLIAEDGWWRDVRHPDQFQRCLQSANCKDGGCSQNREGVLCAICISGYTANGDGLACTDCSSSDSSITKVVFVCVAVIIALAIVNYFWIANVPMNAPDKKHNSKHRGAGAGLIDADAEPVRESSVWEELVRASASRPLSGYNYDTRRIPVAVNLSIRFGIFRFPQRGIITFFTPLGVLILMGGTPLVWLWCCNRRDMADNADSRQKRSHTRRQIVRIISFTIFLTDPTLTCYDSEWMRYLPLAIVGIVLYIVGIPLALSLLLYQNRKKLESWHVQTKYGLAYEPYTNAMYFWEVVDLLFKLMITSLLGFFPESMQAGAGAISTGLYLAAVLFARPFKHKFDDQIELMTLIHVIVLLILGGTVRSQPLTPGSTTDQLLSAFIFLVVVLFLVLLVCNLLVKGRELFRGVQRSAAHRAAAAATQPPPGSSHRRAVSASSSPALDVVDSKSGGSGATATTQTPPLHSARELTEREVFLSPPHAQFANHRRAASSSAFASVSQSLSASPSPHASVFISDSANNFAPAENPSNSIEMSSVQSVASAGIETGAVVPVMHAIDVNHPPAVESTSTSSSAVAPVSASAAADTPATASAPAFDSATASTPAQQVNESTLSIAVTSP